MRLRVFLIVFISCALGIAFFLKKKNPAASNEQNESVTAMKVAPFVPQNQSKKDYKKSKRNTPKSREEPRSIAAIKEELAPRQILDRYPDIAKSNPLELLGRLSATEFKIDSDLNLIGGDDQFQEYGYKTRNKEDVKAWYWTDDASMAIEQIDYSPRERVIRRYFDHTGVMSEVSYEFGLRGGILRFREDGTVESYQAWHKGRDRDELVRYDENGRATEVWHYINGGWTQVF